MSENRMSKINYIAAVELEVSDPWEFGTVHGTGPFYGKLVKLFSSKVYCGDKLAVLKLNKSLDFKAVRYEYLLAQARHTDASITELENGGKVRCNLSAISEGSANANDPLVASREDPRAPGLVGSVSWQKEADKELVP